MVLPDTILKAAILVAALLFGVAYVYAKNERIAKLLAKVMDFLRDLIKF